MRDRIARIVEKMLPTDECVIQPEEIADRILSIEVPGKTVIVSQPIEHCALTRPATIGDLIS